MGEQRNAEGRRGSILLALGMVAGIGLAIVDLVGGTAGLSGDAVARVNDRLILRADWERAVAAVATSRRTPLTSDDRRRILDRLVEEELLVQHGMDMGLVREDRRLRGQLVSDVMASATSGVTAPDDEALRAWFESHRDYFATPGRVRVVATRDGRPFSPPVPDALLPPAKLREYLGPRLTEVTMNLAPGEMRAAEGAVVIRLLQKEPMLTPPFADVRGEVRAAMQRESEEQAVRRLLAALRAESRVVVREDLE
jgi:hypothetical protein